MIIRSAKFTVYATLLLLAACGGSSGGGNSTTPPVSQAGVITSANATTVAGVSVEAALQTGAIGGLTDTGGFVTTTTGGVAKLENRKANQLILKSLRSTVSNIGNVPIGPETTNCGVSGSITVSGDIADPTTLTTGDTISVDSDNCDDGEGQVVDGLLEFVVDSFTPNVNPEVFTVAVTLTVTQLMITEGAKFVTSDGDVSVSIDTSLQSRITVTVSGDIFSVTENNGSNTLRNFSTTVIENTSVFPTAYTTNASGTVESSRFDGSVTYDTPVPFQHFGDGFPFAGELLVTGANNATIRVIAIDAVNVRVETDLDGDGTVDETDDTTWEELTG